MLNLVDSDDSPFSKQDACSFGSFLCVTCHLARTLLGMGKVALFS